MSSPAMLDQVSSLLEESNAFAAQITVAVTARGEGAPGADALESVLERIQRSVVRPLEAALRRLEPEAAATAARGATATPAAAAVAPDPAGVAPDPAGVAPDPAGVAPDPAAVDVQTWLGGESLWRLARDAASLRAGGGGPEELQEASAALQELACRYDPAADSGADESRVAALEKIHAGLQMGILAQRDGPYLVTNAAEMVDWLGQRVPVRPQMALCRCGASAIKPFCDGSHADVGFTGAKDPARVPDKRDTYLGEQVTIFDNRGICQHSGLCTDRIASAFRVDQEPFVAPSGGRMDELVRAVRDCPSGALSYAMDGQEARGQVDREGQRPDVIEITKDGPYRITGAVPLSGPDGAPEPRAEGSSLEHYALCRCGHSQNKPFCSGMHWYVEFKDPVQDADREPTVFEWVGGLPALRRMTRLFYEKHVPQDPLLAPLFANMSPDHPERVAKWLAEVFAGPKDYSGEYGGYVRMISQHLGKGITEEKRTRWVELLLQSAHEAGLPNDPEFRSVFSSYIEWGSRLAVENSQADSHPPEHMPMPHWDWHTAAGAPGSRVSALAPQVAVEDDPVVLPGPDDTVGFERHIRTLFRKRDRQSMEFAFDLWSYDAVKANAPAILARLENGSMPCDGAWPAEKVQAFARWVDSGMAA